ncbi:MAG: ion transporter [Pseudomonadota bacterium]|nr:ion transporter [Pseudomonadota bacterium]
MKQTVLKWVEKASFQNFILTVIVLNALALGVETFHGLSENTLSLLYTFDQVCLVIFVVELLLKIYAYGWSFFKKPWCVFDLLIVAVTLVPNTGNLSVLRGLRVLRVLRLISSVPQLRMVVNGFLDAMPGIGAVGLLFFIIFYVFAVMSTQMFGAAFPDYFGQIGTTMFTLFQLMTLEGWTEIVKDVMTVHSWAGFYFIIYILIATFVLLNMVIAVVVKVMEDEGQAPHTQQLNEVIERLKKIEEKLK